MKQNTQEEDMIQNNEQDQNRLNNSMKQRPHSSFKAQTQK